MTRVTLFDKKKLARASERSILVVTVSETKQESNMRETVNINIKVTKKGNIKIKNNNKNRDVFDSDFFKEAVKSKREVHMDEYWACPHYF